MVDFQRKDLSGAHRHETQQDTEAPHMPNIDIASPIVIAPIDRMSLKVNWVRPGATGIGTVSAPAGYKGGNCAGTSCFAGDEE